MTVDHFCDVLKDYTNRLNAQLAGGYKQAALLTSSLINTLLNEQLRYLGDHVIVPLQTTMLCAAGKEQMEDTKETRPCKCSGGLCWLDVGTLAPGVVCQKSELAESKKDTKQYLTEERP